MHIRYFYLTVKVIGIIFSIKNILKKELWRSIVAEELNLHQHS